MIDSVFQVPLAELIASNQSDVVDKLNANVGATNPAVFVFILSGFSLLVAVTFPTLGALLSILLLLSGIVVYKRFKDSHTLHIHYSLDAVATINFSKTVKALESLASCYRIWTLNTRTASHDSKRNAGAGQLITRKTAGVGVFATEGFSSSLAFSSIKANDMLLHFLPDQILLFANNRYAAIRYEDLNVDAICTRFIETEGVPPDSKKVDTTWRFVNKNGGPDRRFNNNTQIPVVQYGEVTLYTASGLQIILQTSSYEKGAAFTARFNENDKARETRDTHKAPDDMSDVELLLDCYKLLGIAYPASLEEVSAAYRRQASLYHPDKYEHLAPEMKHLASIKMQQINAAYELMKSEIGCR
ncbi:J domain-containing protein [Granulicella aggregans]|uniref:J domain-containing protein n=1 Tax=Granulicella aggregans TaxID=474949 RepID=UPI0021E0301C|nr:J domain-containing protein [Granulicella aggregans]